MMITFCSYTDASVISGTSVNFVFDDAEMPTNDQDIFLALLG
jgi:hypothetical protein